MRVASGSCDRQSSRLPKVSVVTSVSFLMVTAGADAAGLAVAGQPRQVLLTIALAGLLPLAAAIVACRWVARRAAWRSVAAARDGGELARLAAIVGSPADAIVGSTLDGIATSWNPGGSVCTAIPPGK